MLLSRLRDSFFEQRQSLRFYRNRNSIDDTYINLGGLRASCDVSLDVGISSHGIRGFDWRFLNEEKISEFNNHLTSLIYVNLNGVENFLGFLDAIYLKFHGCFIIDSGDYSIATRPSWVGPNANWASPNLINPRWTDGILIPLGLEESRRGTNNTTEHFKNCFEDKDMNVLVGPFANTHLDRECFQSWESNNTIVVAKERMKSKDFDVFSSRFKFVVCPRGNGFDTHRFWETLVRNSIPVVLSSEWASYFQEIGIPLLVLDSFEEIYNFSSTQLHDIYVSLRRELLLRREILTNIFWATKILAMSQ